MTTLAAGEAHDRNVGGAATAVAGVGGDVGDAVMLRIKLRRATTGVKCERLLPGAGTAIGAGGDPELAAGGVVHVTLGTGIDDLRTLGRRRSCGSQRIDLQVSAGASRGSRGSSGIHIEVDAQRRAGRAPVRARAVAVAAPHAAGAYDQAVRSVGIEQVREIEPGSVAGGVRVIDSAGDGAARAIDSQRASFDVHSWDAGAEDRRCGKPLVRAVGIYVVESAIAVVDRQPRSAARARAARGRRAVILRAAEYHRLISRMLRHGNELQHRAG